MTCLLTLIDKRSWKSLVRTTSLVCLAPIGAPEIIWRTLGGGWNPLVFLPAIWLIGTGDNYSRQLNTRGRRMALAGEIQNTFGVEVPLARQTCNIIGSKRCKADWRSSPPALEN